MLSSSLFLIVIAFAGLGLIVGGRKFSQGMFALQEDFSGEDSDQQVAPDVQLLAAVTQDQLKGKRDTKYTRRHDADWDKAKREHEVREKAHRPAQRIRIGKRVKYHSSRNGLRLARIAGYSQKKGKSMQAILVFEGRKGLRVRKHVRELIAA